MSVNMKKEYADYISILESFIHEHPLNLSVDTNWEEILRLAQINNTVGILGYMLMLNPGIADPMLYSMGRSSCMQEISIYARKAEMMNQLVEEIDRRGIDHLLFKGYILRDYYPVPELRTFSDIDFVIRKEDRQRCDDLMMELGFVRHTDWEPVYSYIRGAEYYEVHTEVMEIDVSEKMDYREYYSHIWEKAVNVRNHTYEFSPEDHLIYILTHIAKHINGSGAGIRMYLDIAFFIKRFGEELDWKYFQEQIRILKFEKFVNIVFASVERWFKVNIPIKLKKISDETYEFFTEFTIQGGVYGKEGRDTSLNYLKNQDRSSDKVSKTRTLVNRLFPSASTIEKRYTYLQGKHWLLPAAWMHRLFKTKSTWGMHAVEAKGILNADEKQVIELRRLYKEIGL